MTEEQKQKYVDNIVSGILPEQEVYSKEEVKYLAQTILSWAGEQIEQVSEELKTKDVPEFVANAEFKSIEEAIEDVENHCQDELSRFKDFIVSWLGN